MLTTKQLTFCLEYVKGSNLTKSALLAGYSPKTAYAVASENLKKPQILAKILELRAEIEERIKSELIMTEVEAQERLSNIARAELIDFVEGEEPTINRDIPHHAAASEYTHRTRQDKDGNLITTKSIKLHNPITAIAKLGELKGWFNTLPLGFQDNRTINILVSGEKAKELTEKIGDSFLPEGETAAKE